MLVIDFNIDDSWQMLYVWRYYDSRVNHCQKYYDIFRHHYDKAKKPLSNCKMILYISVK